MARTPVKQSHGRSTTVPFRIHPRAFKALGADLVTNDAVAIIELVKNAYDAYATAVDIRFVEIDGSAGLEIQDNGSGMSKQVIEEAWCTVATPFRQEHSEASMPGKRTRRVSGAKGLGRLSAARLGARLEMVTRTEAGGSWNVRVDWDRVASAQDMSECGVELSRDNQHRLNAPGTLLRIYPLRAAWDEPAVDDLRDNLARLLPPFAGRKDFTIRLTTAGLLKESVEIEPPRFLGHPKYLIKGSVSRKGELKYEYQFRPIAGSGDRDSEKTCSWSDLCEAADDGVLDASSPPRFGPFKFEIRAWDIGPQDTAEIAERFELRRGSIRPDIRAYKGISVYRDGVLVLPKSEGQRDWLGLDVRRIGKVGPRLSTPQIVGHVSITAADNPELEDTSDRERLANNQHVQAFESTLRTIVLFMEQERSRDRRELARERKVVELFQQLDASSLVAGVSDAASAGKSAAETLPLIEKFSQDLDKAREEIETRFVYYSRLATVGTIAHLLVHEVRNRTTVLGNAVAALKAKVTAPPADERLVQKATTAESAVKALDTLADTFAPLANRQFKRRIRSACLEESIVHVMLMLEGDMKQRGITVEKPKAGTTEVAVDPGELETILLNLLQNAVYWTGHKSGEAARRIAVRFSRMRNSDRVQVEVLDSGPGVAVEDVERIFWPGVTNKSGGIGMGLTVASELVAEYGGKLGLDRDGALGGATFLFDVPLKSAEGVRK